MVRYLLSQLTLDQLIEVLFAIVMRLAWRGLFTVDDAACVGKLTQEAITQHGSRAA